MPRTACPTAEQLSAFVLGKLPDGPLEAVAAHTGGCARCQRELQTREAAPDPLVLQIRRPRPEDPVDAEPILTHVLEQVQELAGASTLPWARTEHPWLAPARAPDEMGRLGPYRVLRQIGAGGMGMVYQGEDPDLRRPVALKVMNPFLASQDGPRRRFLHEARAMAALTHDNIVPIYQVGEERGVLFLAMPFLQGETLESRLRRLGLVPGRAALPLTDVLRIGREIAEGLHAAHARGLIHRDVKPSNVWLDAGGDRVKILDFGLARALESDAHLTRTGNILGTPEFMSPEQASGKPVDARSDLFSLGCVLYLLCTGASPFRRASEFDTMLAVTEHAPPSPRDVNPAVPPAAAELVLKLLAKDPDQRPSTARAVADALEALLLPRQRPARLRRWIAWLVAGAAAAALMIATAAIIPTLPSNGKKPNAPGAEPVEQDVGVTRPDPAAPGLPAGPADEAFCKELAVLPPRKQEVVVEAKLKELNPDFHGVVSHTFFNPPIPIRFIGFSTDEVTNISPVRTLPALVFLHCNGSTPGKGKLTDLSPLRGMKLVRLDITNNPVRDVSPLRDLAAGDLVVRRPSGPGSDAPARDQNAAEDQHEAGGGILG